MVSSRLVAIIALFWKSAHAHSTFGSTGGSRGRPWLSSDRLIATLRDSVVDGDLLFEQLPHNRHLQEQTCGQHLESILQGKSADVGSHSCSCSTSRQSGTCRTEIDEVCTRVLCSDETVECVNAEETSVTVCFKSSLVRNLKLVPENADGDINVSEISRTLYSTYTRGVVNVSEQAETVIFEQGSSMPVECQITFDGQACTSCTICADADANDGVFARNMDCSNIDSDAIDNDCHPLDDHVDNKILKFGDQNTSWADSSRLASATLILVFAGILMANLW